MRMPLTLLIVAVAGCFSAAHATSPHADAGDAGSIDASIPAACDWQALALPEHRAMVEVTRQSLLDTIAGADGDAAQLRPLLQRSPLQLGDITGQWRVRSLQFSGGPVYAYSFFAARISRAPCGYAFAKTTGSQRRTGTLQAIDGDALRLAFLGASTVNEDSPRDYDPNRPVDDHRPGEGNSAGNLYRIGRDELLMLLDTGQDFEVYHLRR